MIRPLEKKDIQNISSIHKKELHGFLSELGEDFLKTFYRASLSLPYVFTFVFEEDGRIIGFASASIMSRKILKNIFFTLPFQFLYILLICFITHPWQIVKAVQIFTYPGFGEDRAELLSIAVDRRYHKRGVGKRLLDAIRWEFENRKVKSFIVSAYGRLPANGFYRKMGFQFIKSFNFLGEKMNYYEYDIKKSKIKSRSVRQAQDKKSKIQVKNQK